MKKYLWKLSFYPPGEKGAEWYFVFPTRRQALNQAKNLEGHGYKRYYKFPVPSDGYIITKETEVYFGA